jgi:exodeoxyribonuclease VII small subunit
MDNQTDKQEEFQDFEKYFTRLKNIVDIFSQNNNLTLEKRLSLFKEGMEVYSKCKTILEKAELEAKKMMESGDYSNLLKKEDS